MRKINLNLSIYSISLFLVVFIGIFLRVFAYHHLGYNVIGDECHSIYGSILPIKDLFTNFIQGTNFLPLYRCLLAFLYNIAGINWPLFKLPSIIASILSIFFFYKILNKVFQNKALILGSLALFCLNYTLIHFSMRIKPYSIDILFVLMILYFSICLFDYLKEKNLSLGKTIIYAISSVLMVFTSIPAIMYIQISWFGFFIKSLFEKKYKDVLNLLIFQIIVGGSILCEYFIYISKMQGDNGLKEQWLNDGYYFAPDSFAALNSLVHFSFFKFEFFDMNLYYTLPNYILGIILILFIIGSLKFLMNREKFNDSVFLFYLFVVPILFLVGLSFLQMYPFCNRVIVFLIPVFIVCILNAFLFDKNKLLKIFGGLAFAIFISCMFFYMFKIGELKYLLTDNEQYGMVRKEIEFIENINAKEEIILSNERLCAYCINNKNILILTDEYFVENGEINYFDKRDDQNKITTNIAEMISDYNKIYFFNNVDDYEGLANKYILNELKHLNYKETINTKENNGLFACSVMEKEK